MAASQSPNEAEQQSRGEQDDIVMGGTDEAPAPPTTASTRPFANHPAELLPSKIVEVYPDGNPSMQTRSRDQEAAFERRKTEAMRKMTVPELKVKYKELATQISERLDDNEKKQHDWEAERDKVVQAHELEVRMIKRMLLADKEGQS